MSCFLLNGCPPPPPFCIPKHCPIPLQTAQSTHFGPQFSTVGRHSFMYTGIRYCGSVGT